MMKAVLDRNTEQALAIMATHSERALEMIKGDLG